MNNNYGFKIYSEIEESYRLYRGRYVVMAFVILEPCIPEKAAECVSVCPVDCIEEGPDQFYIDPDVCIDCGACVAVCPVDAIVEEYDLRPEDEVYLTKAEEFFANR